ncbi:helix-turn-helix transcriptional regulator [Erythrobacter sp. EC-HK427]|uniref:helix-turn-helix transcriptional regulator n=1 Tax=Erythrobacter sp. EC-HK427 TaxID=2038396 RepID=UPI0012552957|nr:WYL domain-containing protein [Erythrobacter sp. EC-HK427]VVT00483.1 Predicted DNA-binding transcriptional regulator YafY, contains an HTH and WYL domains [Erythrobacter sp. EC-HK427]
MAERRKAPLDRVLTLVRALADSVEGLTLDEMAEVLGQQRRSAERTRDTIALHFDLDEIEDGRRKRFLIRDSLRRHYVRPNAAELAALQAEVLAATKARSPRAELLDALLVKLRASFDGMEKRRVDRDFAELARLQRTLVGPGAVASVAPETLAAASQAIFAGQCLEFDYRREGEDESVWRRVIPHGILHGTVSYLVAAFPKGGYGLVTYRLDRVQNAVVSDTVGAAPEDFDLDEWLAGSFGMFREQPYEVCLRILPEAAQRAREWRFHPKQELKELADGSVRVTFTSGGLLELANHLFAWAGGLVIESPDELKAVMAKQLYAARTAISSSHQGTAETDAAGE